MSEAVKKKRFFKENGIARIIVALFALLAVLVGRYEEVLVILATGIWVEAVSITELLRARDE